jgi:hypothetical protein
MDAGADILAAFFESLQKAEAIPPQIVERLRELWAQGRLGDKTAIRRAIEEGVGDASENQVN